MGDVVVGTCSWTDKTMIERWYPRGVNTAEARLRYYAARFDTVEVDSSFYGLPRVEDLAHNDTILWYRADWLDKLNLKPPSSPEARFEWHRRTEESLRNSVPLFEQVLLPYRRQRNPEAHTLPAVGPKEKYLGIETPWTNLFCAGDWVRHPAPAFFLERACMTGIEAANAILGRRGLQRWTLVDYLPAEPFVAWIEKLMRLGRKRRKQRNK